MGLAAPLRLSLLEKAAYMDKIIFSVFSPKSLRSKASTSENVSAFVDVKQDFFYSMLQQKLSLFNLIIIYQLANTANKYRNWVGSGREG